MQDCEAFDASAEAVSGEYIMAMQSLPRKRRRLTKQVISKNSHLDDSKKRAPKPVPAMLENRPS